MYNRHFFRSKLGQAAIASTATMAVFVALSTQMHATPALAATTSCHIVQAA